MYPPIHSICVKDLMQRALRRGLTSTDTLQRIEEGHEQVHEHSQVERDAAPE